MAGNIKGINIEIGASTTAFSKAMKDMSSITRATQNELNAVNKALKFDPKNVDLLKQKEELLARQMEDVRTKVEKLKAAKAKADEEMADGTELNQEQYRILVREISAAEGQLKSLIKQNDKFGNSARELGENITGIGKKGMAISGTIIGIGTAAVTMGIKAAQSADDINTLSKQTGLSTEQIQKFQYAADRIDVPLETLTGSLAKLTRNMQSANNGSKNAQLAFDELGISIANNEGILRNNQDVFNEAIDVLASMENETQRDALAMQIFGKSAQDLNPLILGGSEALKQYGEEAEKAGLILSQDTLDSANELGDAVDKLKATATGAFAKVGSEIATKLTPMIEPASDALIKVVDVISDLDDAQIKLIGGIGIGLATVPPLLIGIGQTITAIGTISTAYKTMAASATAASIASSAIPFIGLVTVAGLLIGGISKLNKAFDEQAAEANKVFIENEKVRESYINMKKTAEETAESNLSELAYIEKLKNELIDLADESGRVADADKARAEFIIGQLNGALGTEYTMTGNLINKYGEFSSAIDAVITKKKAEIILSSKEESYRAAVSNVEAQASAVNELTEKYNKAKKAFDEYSAEIQKKKAENENYHMSFAESDWLLNLQSTMQVAKAELEDSSKVYGETMSIIKDYETTYASILEDGGKTVAAEWENRTTVLTKEQKKAGKSYSDAVIELADYTEKYKQGVKGYTQAGIEELQKKVETSKAEAEKIGVSINEGMVVGLGNDSKLKNAVAKLCANVPQWAKKLLGINSPAKIAIPIGEAIPEGIAVGIKKDMSAEEALEKKVSNLKKILSDYTSYYKTNIGVAESTYDLWLSENPSADENEKVYQKSLLLNATLLEQEKIVQSINDAIQHQIKLTGEESQEVKNMVTDLNRAKLDVNETKTELNKLQFVPQYSQIRSERTESDYNLWLAQNPEATEIEKLAQQEKMLNIQYEEQGKNVQDLNDELYLQIQLSGENSEASQKLLIQLNQEKAAYAKLGTEISNVSKAKQKAQITPQFSQDNVDLAQSQYILWQAQNPEATEVEKLIAQEKMLNTQYEEQGKNVQDLNDELYLQIQLNGENSEESKKLLIQLNQEKAAYENLAAEIARVNEEKAKAANKAYNDYASYKRVYEASLLSAGYSAEDVDKAARKSSGYTGERNITIQNNNYGVTPETAYTVTKKTEQNINNMAMQGRL